MKLHQMVGDISMFYTNWRFYCTMVVRGHTEFYAKLSHFHRQRRSESLGKEHSDTLSCLEGDVGDKKVSKLLTDDRQRYRIPVGTNQSSMCPCLRYNIGLGDRNRKRKDVQ
jgi:hypothetical protein